ncbi:hypothetical protein OpiT1DRAFT_02258 [Opitutaceae bacterium TAV1]|nr:hypothetical protein OpiT1DRAFT_02258 [Opitutaceae bacterium TAV1]
MIRAALVLLTAAFLVLGTSGCTTKTKDDSSIPWSRPASWEGQAPGGMGGFGNYR